MFSKKAIITLVALGTAIASVSASAVTNAQQGIRALAKSQSKRSDPFTKLVARQNDPEVCLSQSCTDIDAQVLALLADCSESDTACQCGYFEALSSSCLGCLGGYTTVDEVRQLYASCNLVPANPSEATCQALCAADGSALASIQNCADGDQDCICDGILSLTSYACLDCVLILGGSDATAGDTVQTCQGASAGVGGGDSSSDVESSTSRPVATVSRPGASGVVTDSVSTTPAAPTGGSGGGLSISRGSAAVSQSSAINSIATGITRAVTSAAGTTQGSGSGSGGSGSGSSGGLSGAAFISAPVNAALGSLFIVATVAALL